MRKQIDDFTIIAPSLSSLDCIRPYIYFNDICFQDVYFIDRSLRFENLIH